ncbi:MAG TPA: autotransporter-associated beta strand repeat-containing protein [Verrucomicrobiae bacterium]|nr:autotransporter-associated beta strand repeat-containing protein [Verrucomicrobiae bacterium]
MLNTHTPVRDSHIPAQAQIGDGSRVNKCKRLLHILVLAALCLFWANSTRANIHTWTGSANGLWSNPSNWVTNSPPEVIETLPIQIIFPPGVSRTSVTNDIYNEFFGALGADSLVITGNNYHFYGKGGGINLVLSGRSGPFPGGYNVNVYCAGTNVTFDGTMNLILDDTNTISTSSAASLDIQAALTGTGGGWTYEGSGQMTLDGTNANSCTGSCWVNGGTVFLGKYSCGIFNCLGIPALAGPLQIGTFLGPSSQVVEEYALSGQLASSVTIAETGSLVLKGYASEIITNLTLYGGTVSLAGALVNSESGGVPVSGTNYGSLTVGTLTSYASPFGGSSQIIGFGSTFGPFSAPRLTLMSPDSSSNTYIDVVSGLLELNTDIETENDVNAIVKNGIGSLLVTGTNLYGASTIIEQGEVIAQTAGAEPLGVQYSGSTNAVVVESGAQLTLTSSNLIEIPVLINGYGTNGTGGAIVVEADGSVLDGGAVVASDSAVLVSDASANLTAEGGIYPAVAGSANFHKTGPGTLSLGGTSLTNCFTGTTYVDAGTFLLQAYTDNGFYPATLMLNGPVVVGPAGTNSTVVLEEQYASNQISSNVMVTINDGAQINLQDNSQTFGPLALNGGILADGDVTLNGNVTAQNGPSESVLFFVDISLDGSNRTFTVASNSILSVFAPMTDGGIIKAGPGEMDLAASNTYAGPTLVTAGILAIIDNGTPGALTSGTVISNGAELELEDGVHVGAQTLTVSGSGGGVGAIVATGTNSWAGNITMPTTTTLLIEGQTTFSGSIGVTIGGVIQQGTGTLILNGTAPNTFTTSWELAQGNLNLSKTNAVAIPGPLTIGNDFFSPDSVIVQVLQANQFSSNSDISIASDGLLSLSAACVAGSISGSGQVAIANGPLSVGYDNLSTTFSGPITGLAGGFLIKAGFGALTLSGSSSYFGQTQVASGTMYVDGFLGHSSVSVDNQATLGGNGTIGALTALNGSTISPGHSPGMLRVGSLALNSGSTYLVEINGASHDQINASGAITLANPTLKTVFLSPASTNQQYSIINNNSGSAAAGTFTGLSEGGALTANNGAKLKITYKGGATDNVVLTSTSAMPQPVFDSVTRSGGAILLNGVGVTNLTYSVWAGTNLNSTNWLDIGSAAANGAGTLQFTDSAATNFPQRFYILSWP